MDPRAALREAESEDRRRALRAGLEQRAGELAEEERFEGAAPSEGFEADLRATRVVADFPVACPAGMPVGEVLAGAGCRCRVTSTTITSGEEPNSLRAFCLNGQGYRQCPAWQAEKDRIAERRASLSETDPRGRRKAMSELRREAMA